MQIRRSVLLIAAFGALIAVIAVSAYAVWRNARNAQARTAALYATDLETHGALAAIRANVYLTGILTRDYLLDSDATHAQQYVDQFAAVRFKTEQNFQVLETAAQDEAQKLALRRLREELDAYWDPTEVVLDWSPREKQAQRAEMLRQRVRRREEIFALASQIEQLITQDSTRERQRFASADQEFRSSLGWTAGIALLLALIISGTTLTRVWVLERHSQEVESALRLLSGQIRTTQEAERKFLSRELHDQVGQMLTGLRMELARIARLHGDSNSEISSRIAAAKGTVEHTLGIVRNIAMLLRPSMLDDLGLTPALAWLVKEVSRSSGMDIQADIGPEVDLLPDAHRTCIYRVVQEALTNASRHSGARKAELTVKGADAWVDVALTDDGRGFITGTERRKGLGLLGMEERVRELGGTIRVISSPGRGTRVEIRLPRPHPTETLDAQDSDRGRSRDRSGRVKTSL
jgi:signal transduction histidine kinase